MDRITIIASEFNKSLVEELYQQALEGLKGYKGFKNPDQLETCWVPGAGEIPLMAKWAIEKRQAMGVLGLGVVIRGQTAHFDFLKDFLQNALWSLQNQYAVPVIFSVLLLENREQAPDRISRAKTGMQALLNMLELKKNSS